MDRTSESRVALLRIPRERILELLRVEGLPADVELVQASYEPATDCLALLLSSQEFHPKASLAEAYCLTGVVVQNQSCMKVDSLIP